MNKVSVKPDSLFIIFVISLIPISVQTSFSGISINYFYLFIFFLPFIKFRFSPVGFSLIVVYSVVFLTGMIDFLNNGSFYFVRVVASFIVFIIPFLFVFIKIRDEHFEKFKQALVFFSLVYSFVSISQLVLLGYSGDFFLAKDLIGSQRFGFVIIFSFFILLFSNHYKMLLKMCLLLLLAIGIALTFSRSSLVAFAFVLVYVGLTHGGKIKIKYFILASSFLLVTIIIFKNTIIGQIVAFSSNYLASFKNYNLNSSTTSEGYRVYVFNQIMDYVSKHPLFGSSYAGLYLLYDEYSTVGASSHSQYTDVLLRTGFVGFTLYMVLLARMTLFYKRIDKGVFYGLIGILVYGVFHETFKLGHGSFIFAMLVSYFFAKKKEYTHSPNHHQIQKLPLSRGM